MGKKVDLKSTFNAIDYNNMDFYETIKVDYSPWVVMRWASSSTSNTMWYLMYTNALVNRHFSTCNEHEKLQWISTSLVGNGTNNYYKWIPPYKKKKANTKESKFFNYIKQIHPDWKDSEVGVFIYVNTEEDLKNYIEENGIEYI